MAPALPAKQYKSAMRPLSTTQHLRIQVWFLPSKLLLWKLPCFLSLVLLNIETIDNVSLCQKTCAFWITIQSLSFHFLLSRTDQLTRSCGPLLESYCVQLRNGRMGTGIWLVSCSVDSLAFEHCLNKPNLHKLTVTKWSGVSSTEVIQAPAGASSLAQLDVSLLYPGFDHSVHNLAPLSTFTQLCDLKLWDFRLQDIRPVLAALPLLEYL